jgi:Fic family protein
MNKRQVIILWVIAIALGGAVAAVKLTAKGHHKSATKRAPGETLFETFPAADIATVEIKGAEGIRHPRQKGRQMDRRRARQLPRQRLDVNDFIRTLAELKVTRGMEAGPSFAPRFGMDENASKAEDRGLTADLQGRRRQGTRHRFARQEHRKRRRCRTDGRRRCPWAATSATTPTSPASTPSARCSRRQRRAPRWLADDFISPEKIKSISLSQRTRRTTAWKLTRETEEAEFKLDGAAGERSARHHRATPLKSLFSYARFDDVSRRKVAERADAEGKRNAVIETFEGFIYQLGTVTPVKDAEGQDADDRCSRQRRAAEGTQEGGGRETRGRQDQGRGLHRPPQDAHRKTRKGKSLEGRTFEVAKSTVESLLKERDQLITKAEAPPAADATTGSVETHPGGIIASPPVQAPAQPRRTATTPPIEAVTPPIAVPPRPLEAAFLHRSGVHVGAFFHLNDEDRENLRAELLSDEALLTSKIEGEFLNRDSLQSSIRRLFGMPDDSRKVAPAEQGISELLVDVYRNFAASLSDAQLFEWHRMVVRGRWDLKTVGAYRSHDEPMRIVSGAIHDPTVHFEAPSSAVVPEEMRKFIGWFNGSAAALPGLARAGIAHLWFESIHPFEDGNGRIGRGIAEKALSQALGQPTLVALSSIMERDRMTYYDALGKASRSIEITGWLEYFGNTVLEAQDHTLRRIEFLIRKTKFFERFSGRLNPRQEKVMLRMFREGPEGFAGGLSSKNYVSITRCSPATATRDLSDLVERGALVRTGERKHARYALKLEEA